jgi:CBS domain-containing protein
MKLQEILRVKGSGVHTIHPGATLDEVVQMLVNCKCGSLVVREPADAGGPPGAMVGIISERDILRVIAARRGALDTLLTADAMTRDVITGSPDDSIDDTMGLMTDRRIRHLPIIDGGELAGMISIGDVVKAHHDQVALENHYLKSYIQS